MFVARGLVCTVCGRGLFRNILVLSSFILVTAVWRDVPLTIGIDAAFILLVVLIKLVMPNMKLEVKVQLTGLQRHRVVLDESREGSFIG